MAMAGGSTGLYDSCGENLAWEIEEFTTRTSLPVTLFVPQRLRYRDCISKQVQKRALGFGLKRNSVGSFFLLWRHCLQVCFRYQHAAGFYQNLAVPNAFPSYTLTISTYNRPQDIVLDCERPCVAMELGTEMMVRMERTDPPLRMLLAGRAFVQRIGKGSLPRPIGNTTGLAISELPKSVP